MNAPHIRPALTPREHHACIVIRAFTDCVGRPPTVGELRRGLGMKWRTQAERTLTALRRKGALQ